jgi:hypothetical protein
MPKLFREAEPRGSGGVPPETVHHGSLDIQHIVKLEGYELVYQELSEKIPERFWFLANNFAIAAFWFFLRCARVS